MCVNIKENENKKHALRNIISSKYIYHIINGKKSCLILEVCTWHLSQAFHISYISLSNNNMSQSTWLLHARSVLHSIASTVTHPRYINFYQNDLGTSPKACWTAYIQINPFIRMEKKSRLVNKWQIGQQNLKSPSPVIKEWKISNFWCGWDAIQLQRLVSPRIN